MFLAIIPCDILLNGMDERDSQDKQKLKGVLQPYAANWTGTLGRGDLVVPQREIDRLINDLFDAVRASEPSEATDRELFDALTEARRSASVQDQVDRLRVSFRILKR